MMSGQLPFELSFQRKSSGTRQWISQARGRRERVTERRESFVYQLKPKQAGTIRVPAPTVEADGRTLQGPQRTITVEKNEQDWLILEACSQLP